MKHFENYIQYDTEEATHISSCPEGKTSLYRMKYAYFVTIPGKIVPVSYEEALGLYVGRLSVRLVSREVAFPWEG